MRRPPSKGPRRGVAPRLQRGARCRNTAQAARLRRGARDWNPVQAIRGAIIAAGMRRPHSPSTITQPACGGGTPQARLISRLDVPLLLGGDLDAGDAGAGVGGQVVDDRVQVAGLAEYAQLAVRAAPLLEQGIHVADLLSGAELVDDIVNELDQLQCQVAHGHLLLLAEVDQAALEAVPDGAPLVLVDQVGQVLAEPLVLTAEFEQLGADRLDQCRQAEGFVHPGGGIADPELDGGVEDVRAQVPPDLLAVVDAAGSYQQVDEILELVPGREVGRDPGARKARPDDAAV